MICLTLHILALSLLSLSARRAVFLKDAKEKRMGNGEDNNKCMPLTCPSYSTLIRTMPAGVEVRAADQGRRLTDCVQVVDRVLFLNLLRHVAVVLSFCVSQDSDPVSDALRQEKCQEQPAFPGSTYFALRRTIQNGELPPLEPMCSFPAPLLIISNSPDHPMSRRLAGSSMRWCTHVLYLTNSQPAEYRNKRREKRGSVQKEVEIDGNLRHFRVQVEASQVWSGLFG